MAEPFFRVMIRQNLVTEIRRMAPGDDPGAEPSDDQLAVSSRLAQNNLANGCLDGDYDLASFESARQFAALCLGFLKNLCETSLDSVAEAGKEGEESWRNPLVASVPERVGGAPAE